MPESTVWTGRLTFDEKLSAKIDDLDKGLNMAQRLAILETKMGELQPKA